MLGRTSKWWRKLTQALRLSLGFMLLVALVGAGRPSPLETVRDTVNHVIDILNDKAWAQPERFLERRRVLEEVIGSRFDYEEMAKRSLGTHWNALTGDERNVFVGLFASFLSASYADKIEGYSGQDIHYTKERTANHFAEVRTTVVSGKAEFPLDYRLVEKSGNWYVYDVIIDGVSLVKNYRGQFDRTIRSSSYEALVDKLRTKVEEAKRRKPKS